MTSRRTTEPPAWVPGSHLWNRLPEDVLARPEGPAPAGATDSGARRQRGGLQRAHLARPAPPTAPRATPPGLARLLRAPRHPTTTMAENVVAARNPGTLHRTAALSARPGRPPERRALRPGHRPKRLPQVTRRHHCPTRMKEWANCTTSRTGGRPRPLARALPDRSLHQRLATTSCTPATSAPWNAASSSADVLILALNSDSSVRAIKGPQRPIIDQRETRRPGLRAGRRGCRGAVR